jgi:hypothetical protein
MAKKCNRCEEIKSIDAFSVAKRNKDGRSTLCKACVVLRNTEYWRTPTGRISQIYAVQVMNSKQRQHLAPSYTRSELITWAISNNLDNIWATWKASNYSKELTPSVDRINPNSGYAFGNIRLVTWEQNNDKAYSDRKECVHITKQNRKVIQKDLEGNHIATFASISSASRNLGITRVNINDVCRKKAHCKTAGGFIWEYL